MDTQVNYTNLDIKAELVRKGIHMKDIANVLLVSKQTVTNCLAVDADGNYRRRNPDVRAWVARCLEIDYEALWGEPRPR